jgi:orotidine-5'-phosphate decarboxylase
MTEHPEAPDPLDPRDRLVLALDVGGLAEAEAMAARVGEWFGIVKVGLELYAEAGPAAFGIFHDLGYRVFADLKLHDIPNTVARAARVLGRRGVTFLNFHTSGGVVMLRGGVDALKEGAREAGHPEPIALGVTVLTSEADTTAFAERLECARAAGCDGVVCSAFEAPRARDAGLDSMVLGIRLPGGDPHDQARVSDPAQAIASGATWLGIGRAVTEAPNPEEAAAAVAKMVENATRH